MGSGRTVRRALLDHFFGKATYTPPTTFYIGLSNTQPTSLGNNVNEPADAAYDRILTAPADWSAASDADPAVSSNLNPVAFSTATVDWLGGADIGYAVMYDALTGGNFLGYGSFARSKNILVDDTLTIAAGKLLVNLT
jgi:hypothetical protein